MGERIVDDAHQGPAVVGEGEGDGDVGVAVYEVCGTVYRVDDEGRGVCEAGGTGCGFFAQEGVGGVSFGEGGRDGCFDGFVGLGH